MLTGPDFARFFQTATGHLPYPYQTEIAAHPPRSGIWHIPTGMGKTAAAVLAWLWRRHTDAGRAPQRLVYCLPTRVLVEQVAADVSRWLERLGKAAEIPVHVLMGGSEEAEWHASPERAAVLIGTQDMLLSRALNRGYAASRYGWPASFGLLNSDCVWVFDETQLFGAGLASSAQLAAFRENFGVFGACPSIWMSATPDASGLRTVDFENRAAALPVLRLGAEDLADPRVARRLHAPKRIAAAPEECRAPAGLAAFVMREHAPGAQTLVVVNRVARAREIHAALENAGPAPELLLLHSRFRGHERRAQHDALTAKPGRDGRIIVSTQVIEAGVDLSSELLVTDLAPFSSMAQRFGRNNRDGALDRGRIFWVDRPLTAKEARLAEEKQIAAAALPYLPADLEQARARLLDLESASSADLPDVAPPAEAVDVLRRRDLIDLFDTTRDLAGFDIDISRFVRGGSDHDVFAAWRELAGEPPRPDCPAPARDELCSVPIGEMKAFLEPSKGRKRVCAWSWDGAADLWQPVRADQLRPGLTILLDAAAGGYREHGGWDGAAPGPVPPALSGGDGEEALNEDRLARQRYRQTLEAHSREVGLQMERLVAELDQLALAEHIPALLEGARAHDDGKAHPVFQRTLHGGREYSVLLAKSNAGGRHERPHFRHELASALALLARGAPDLAVYLAAAHHGKVRLSIRAMPGERPPEAAGVRFARGVHDGDPLPPARAGQAGIVLDLEPMILGAGSWVDRMTRLRDTLGPFRLAYLEALMRAADIAASRAPLEVLS